MKTYIIFFFALLLGLNSSFAQKDKFTVRVDGLGCPFCAYGIDKKFKDVEGLSKFSIELESGILTFEVPSKKAMSIEQAEERVIAAGYTPRAVSILRADGQVEKKEQAVAVATDGELVRKSFQVAGSCDMCKSRIEASALSVKGVKNAEWIAERQMLTVDYDGTVSQLGDVQAAVAKAGHDNAGGKSSSKTYASLPGCCQYR